MTEECLKKTHIKMLEEEREISKAKEILTKRQIHLKMIESKIVKLNALKNNNILILPATIESIGIHKKI